MKKGTIDVVRTRRAFAKLMVMPTPEPDLTSYIARRITGKRDRLTILEKRLATLEARMDWLERDQKDAKRKGKG